MRISFRRYYLAPFKPMNTSSHILQMKTNLFYPVAFYSGPNLHSNLNQQLLDILEKVIELTMLRAPVESS